MKYDRNKVIREFEDLQKEFEDVARRLGPVVEAYHEALDEERHLTARYRELNNELARKRNAYDRAKYGR